MATKKTSIAQFVKKQVTKWEQMYSQADRQTEARIPINYELTINTGKMSLESSVEAVIGAVMATLPNPS